jgi:hypothetical protein
VVHQVGPARHAAGRERERLDLVRPGLGRRWDRRTGCTTIDVVEQADAHAARGRVAQRPEDQPFIVVREIDVVDRDVERALCMFEERCEQARDLDRGLAAVRERSDFDQVEARSFALYARFASW